MVNQLDRQPERSGGASGSSACCGVGEAGCLRRRSVTKERLEVGARIAVLQYDSGRVVSDRQHTGHVSVSDATQTRSFHQELRPQHIDRNNQFDSMF